MSNRRTHIYYTVKAPTSYLCVNSVLNAINYRCDVGRSTWDASLLHKGSYQIGRPDSGPLNHGNGCKSSTMWCRHLATAFNCRSKIARAKIQQVIYKVYCISYYYYSCQRRRWTRYTSSCSFWRTLQLLRHRTLIACDCTHQTRAIHAVYNTEDKNVLRQCPWQDLHICCITHHQRVYNAASELVPCMGTGTPLVTPENSFSDIRIPDEVS